MSTPVQIKAIFFDMDGVLVDASSSYRRAVEETASHFTGRVPDGGAVQRYKNRGGFHDDWRLTHALVTEAGMEVPLSRIVEEFQRRYRGDNWDGLIAEEPALIRTETLEQLATGGRILGVVTGRPDAEARWTLGRFGWQRFFPLIIGKEKQEGRGMPDPFPLVHALAVCDAAGRRILPQEAVYVGDSVDDIVAARAAGLWAVGVVPPHLNAVTHAERLRDRGAHAVADGCDNLPELIDALPTRMMPAPDTGV